MVQLSLLSSNSIVVAQPFVPKAGVGRATLERWVEAIFPILASGSQSRLSDAAFSLLASFALPPDYGGAIPELE